MGLKSLKVMELPILTWQLMEQFLYQGNKFIHKVHTLPQYLTIPGALLLTLQVVQFTVSPLLGLLAAVRCLLDQMSTCFHTLRLQEEGACVHRVTMYATITKNSARIITTCNIRWTSPSMGRRGSSNLSALSEARVISQGFFRGSQKFCTNIDFQCFIRRL